MTFQIDSVDMNKNNSEVLGELGNSENKPNSDSIPKEYEDILRVFPDKKLHQYSSLIMHSGFRTKTKK